MKVAFLGFFFIFLIFLYLSQYGDKKSEPKRDHSRSTVQFDKEVNRNPEDSEE